MRKTLVVFFWLLATIGLTYVTNAAVKLVDLQVLPEGSRIEVLSLPKVATEEEVSVSDSSVITIPPSSSQPVSTSSTLSLSDKSDNKSTATSTTIPLEEEIKPQTTVPPVSTIVVNSENDFSADTEDATTSQDDDSDTDLELTFADTEDLTVETTDFPTPTTITTTTQPAAVEPIEIIIDPILIETISLPKVQIGENYQAQLEATGGIPPYRWEINSGSLPEELTFSENGLIAGVLSSGVQEKLTFKTFDDVNSSAISKELMLENTKTRQTVIARGGTAFIDIDGDYVSLFLVSPADGYSAVIVEPGGFRVEVQFVPQLGDSTSFVVCESNEGLKCSSDQKFIGFQGFLRVLRFFYIGFALIAHCLFVVVIALSLASVLSLFFEESGLSTFNLLTN